MNQEPNQDSPAEPTLESTRAPRAPRSPESLESARAFAIEAARLASDMRCEHVVVIDVHEQSPVTDFVVVASGTSDRQMASVLDDIQELGKEHDHADARTNLDERSLWLLADFADVVVHLFEPGTRAHYDLEMLYGNSPFVEWQDPDNKSTDHAGLNRPPTRG